MANIKNNIKPNKPLILAPTRPEKRITKTNAGYDILSFFKFIKVSLAGEKGNRTLLDK